MSLLSIFIVFYLRAIYITSYSIKSNWIVFWSQAFNSTLLANQPRNISLISIEFLTLSWSCIILFLLLPFDPKFCRIVKRSTGSSLIQVVHEHWGSLEFFSLKALAEMQLFLKILQYMTKGTLTGSFRKNLLWLKSTELSQDVRSKDSTVHSLKLCPQLLSLKLF